MAVQTGLAKPVERPRSTRSQNLDKEDGTRKSQKILLTWMASDENVFAQIQKYIHPEDFTGRDISDCSRAFICAARTGKAQSGADHESFYR